MSVYADTSLFADAISEHLAGRAGDLAPRHAELDAAQAAIAAAERKLTRYRDDYEAERISGETYEEAKSRLGEELRKARERATELEVAIARQDVGVAPTDTDRATLHAALVERVRTGSVPARKAMFTALVERLEVHALDDVRPVFRLGGPGLMDLPAVGNSAGQEPERATAGEMFASRASGWR